MGFSVFVEMLNLQLRSARKPIKLHQQYAPAPGDGTDSALLRVVTG